jgi:homoserine kinase
LKIPKSFTLAGIRWTVEETAVISEMGHCSAETATIRLRKDLPEQVKAATFCHELQHAILYTMGLDEHDEKLVDAQGNLLHQFLSQYGR